MHLESWLLRGALLALAGYQLLVNHNQPGAIVAAQGFVIALIPVAVSRLSRTHVPRALDAAFTAAIALQYASESTKLFEIYTYWDKIVHPTEVALTALMAGWLLLGYAHAYGKRIPLHFGAAFGLLIGTSVGAAWEFVEFASDWFEGANLQKSNADTMTDIIANDIGAFVATLLGMWLFSRVLDNRQRDEMGRIGSWLAHGPGEVLARHGRLVGASVAVLFAAVLFAGRWIDRDVPGPGPATGGLVPGTSVSLDFTAVPLDNTQILAGDWVPDPRGICRVNLEQPRPGSEKPGILQLAPGSAYGEQPYRVEARYFEERPEPSVGTAMDAGIAVGIRDETDYDLLEQSALHDVLRLDHTVHDRRRDVRETLFRTHANEWHTLQVDVDGSTVTASVDGQAIFTATDVPTTDGGVGLWARAAASTCFSDARITVGGAAP